MSTATYTITAQEQTEGRQQIAALEAELIIARDRYEEQLVLMARDENWMNHSEQRRKVELSRDVVNLETRIGRLTAFLASATVADDQPEPEPPAPAMRPIMIPAPTRFRVSVAWYHSTCSLTGQRIRPGDEICNYQGKWALYAAAVADDDRRRAEAPQRRADRAYVDQVEALIGRMPVAA